MASTLVLATTTTTTNIEDRDAIVDITWLPNEVLLMIFSMSDDFHAIGMIAQVCRLWHELAASPILQLHPRFELGIRFAKYSSSQLDPDTVLTSESSIGSIVCDAHTTGQLYVANGNKITVLSADGKQINSLDEHTDIVCVLAIGPTGLLYSGSYDKTIRIWTPKGKCISTQINPTTVRALAISPNGRKLYSGGHDKLVRIWPLDASGVPDDDDAGVKLITGHNSGAYALAVAPDGKTFYSGAGSKDAKIRVWTAEGELVRQLVGHTAGIYSLCVDSQGFLYSGSADKMVRMWSTTGETVRRFRGHRHAVNAITVCEDKLYTASLDKSVRVWDRQSAQQRAMFNKHSKSVTSLAMASKIGRASCRERV